MNLEYGVNMIPNIITALLPVLGDVIDRFLPDKTEAAKVKAEMEFKLLETVNSINLGQIEINKQEAQHRSPYVAGWRPFIGWACAAGFMWAFLGKPIVSWIIAIYDPTLVLPELDIDGLLEMTFGMLGLAGLRSWEKSRGLIK